MKKNTKKQNCKLTVVVPSDLHKAVTDAAQAKLQSVSTYLRDLILASTSKKEAE